MKNTILVILMALVLAFSACGTKTTTTDKEVENNTKVEENTEVKEETEKAPEEEIEQEAEKPADEKENEKTEEKVEETQKPQEEVKPQEQQKPAKPQEEVKPQKPQEQQKPTKPQEEQKPSKPQGEEKPQKPQGDTRSLPEIMSSITSNLGEMPMLGEIELDKENFSFYTFADYVEGAEGYVSEPMMGSFAHSVVLVRLPEGADVNAFAAKVKANADPRKWICVEAETVEVRTKGNLVLLVMSSKETANKIVSRF